MNKTLLFLVSAFFELTLAALALAVSSYTMTVLWLFCVMLDLHSFVKTPDHQRSLPFWVYTFLGVWNFISMFQSLEKHDVNGAVQNGVCVLLVLVWIYQQSVPNDKE